MEKYFLIGALIIAFIGAVKDVRVKRIPNRLTYSGLLAGLVVRLAVSGWPGLRGGLLGVVLGGGLFFALFLLGGMGGGDVKLMAAVGAWAGIMQTAYVVLLTAMAGGVLALVYIVSHKQVSLALTNTVELLRHHMTSGFQTHPALNVREPNSLRIPYGLAIAVGTLFCAGSAFWRG